MHKMVFIQLFGFAYACVGILFLIKPASLRGYVHFWKESPRAYFGGLLAGLIGIAFLVVAGQCRWPWFVVGFGILALLKGVLIYALGLERIKSMLQWYDSKPPQFFRVMGLVAFVLGVLLFYSA